MVLIKTIIHMFNSMNTEFEVLYKDNMDTRCPVFLNKGKVYHEEVFDVDIIDELFEYTLEDYLKTENMKNGVYYLVIESDVEYTTTPSNPNGLSETDVEINMNIIENKLLTDDDGEIDAIWEKL